MNIAIVGCGLIGRKRAVALSTDHQSKLVIVADIDAARVEHLAREHGCQATTDWEQVVNHQQVEAVIVSTVNKFLMPIAVAALERGKHVLCEKPLGRNASEAQRMVEAARTCHSERSEGSLVLKTGFNHRHHPAIWQAHELCSSGAIGPLMFIRSVYGHGGRVGYDKEWRADPDLAGGGELLDQGVHIIDLCRWFLGDFTEVTGYTGTYFWDLGRFGTVNAIAPQAKRSGGEQWTVNSNQYSVDSKTQVPSSKFQSPISNFSERSGDPRRGREVERPALSTGQAPTTEPPDYLTTKLPNYPTSLRLEDNGFAMLRTAAGQIATFHTSWTQWKNRFTFEVFGRDGYVIVDGLGGSYGTEKLIVGHRRPESGPPIEECYEFPGPDLSWQAEWQEFTSAIRENRQPLANGEDGLQVMQLIDAMYRSSRTGQVVKLDN